MCGIFGAVVGNSSRLRQGGQIERSLRQMFVLSESRGKEAAGLAIANDDQLAVFKTPTAASDMVRSRGYKSFLREAIANGHSTNGVAFIGHSRLVTDGARETNRNNQPVMARGVVGIHNGIIVNHAQVWQRHQHLLRKYEVDSEVIFALIRDQLDRGATMIDATRATFAEIEGAASIATLFDDRDQLLLATNNGSLYYRHAPRTGVLVFASERYIMDQFAKKHPDLIGGIDTVHVRPGQGVLVELQDLSVITFELALTSAVATNGKPSAASSVRAAPRTVVDRAVADRKIIPPVPVLDLARIEARFPYVSMRDRLRRCTRCVLPETMPFVAFDADGLCAYCRMHRTVPVKGIGALEALIAPHRRSDGRPDCVVGLSGGRDSMFGLHYLKTVLGLNPIAYTYDWGMVTDLARRNISRICGQLGIEHLWVSADIPQKRAFVRKNVEAWLARPSLGTIPLFMAGDKAYFHYLNKAREQLGIKLGFLCENPLERTDFKTGFAGIPPIRYDDDHGYTLPLHNKVTLAGYYAGQFARNPRFLNSSLLDTAMGFAYYYVMKRDYDNLYRYVQWDEAVIEKTLLGTYGFELADDTRSTWRIGDGTASFYNYIYYAIAGMTENDTFRSNQIRVGAITRERALELIERDNQARFPSIHWYLRTIGTTQSIEQVLETIQRAPKLWARA